LQSFQWLNYKYCKCILNWTKNGKYQPRINRLQAVGVQNTTQTAVGKPGIEEHFYLIWSNIVIILRFTLILQQKMSEGTLGSKNSTGGSNSNSTNG
jgi:hypothetical protein